MNGNQNNFLFVLNGQFLLKSRKMLSNCTVKDDIPVPAYGTTRYNGTINFKENINKYYINASRKKFFGFSPPCAKIDKWSEESVNDKL